MKTGLVFILLFTGIFFQQTNLSNTSDVIPTIQSKETVYICNSKGATKYHAEENCRGLNNCKAEILSVDKKEAIKLGREECGWCY